MAPETLEEQLNELRWEYCKGCRRNYSREEVLGGAQCGFCDHVEETGRMVAGLQD